MQRGVLVNLANGVFPAGGKVVIPVVNPRGKPSFARKITVNNTDTTAITVIFPQAVGDTTSNPDVATTVAPSTARDFECSSVPSITLVGTATKKYEVTATVAG